MTNKKAGLPIYRQPGFFVSAITRRISTTMRIVLLNFPPESLEKQKNHADLVNPV
jgi:hypothetical protein